MKCNAYILPNKKTGKKGRAFPSHSHFSLDAYLKTLTTKQRDSLDLDNIQRCDGQIKVHITAIDEPYFGGTSAALDVRFQCNKCHCDMFPDLPDTYRFVDWVNALLDKMD